jgi:Multisubunit Na+/H+ antiporter, MnhF subunit
MNWTDIFFYLGWAFFLPGLAISVWRIGKGPTTLDRMLGIDLLTVTVVALMILVSLREGTTDYVELIIIVAALGFFSTVAYYYYLSQLPAVEGELGEKEEND